MKRLLCILLAISLCLSLCCCGQGSAPATAPESTPAPAQPTVPSTEAPTVPTTQPETYPPQTLPPETVPIVTEPETVGSTPLLYRVTDAEGHELWLFGSVHVGIEEMYPLPDYVMDAYHAADALAVECDVIEAQNDLDAMMDMLMPMIYTDGTTIKDHISSDLYTAAVKILKENGSYNFALDYYKPVLWYSFVESFSYEDYGYDAESGIDMYLLTDAKATGKPIKEVESVTFQYGLLASFSEELQVLLLEEAVAGYGSAEGKEALDGLLSAWCKGEEAALLPYLDSEGDTDGYDEAAAQLIREFNTAMVTDRNIAMARYAADALASGEKLFICVGTAHILGDGAMVDLLQQQGYTVEQVH